MSARPLVRARGLGVRFLLDRHRRSITPARARFSRGTREQWGLRDVDLEICSGEGLALLGRSGSGKSTLLGAIAGVLPADGGELCVEGTVNALLSRGAGLHGKLDGFQNSMLLGVMAGLSRAEMRAAMPEVRQLSELGEAFDAAANTYSNGMRARLGFYACAPARPDLLLLDEIHEALDHDFRTRLADHARQRLDDGGVVVAAGHDHQMLGRLCSRAAWLEDGRIRQLGDFEAVRVAYMDSM